MRIKLAFGAGLAIGYLLGARAGRERYDQIVRAAESFRSNPTVQEKVSSVQQQAGSLLGSAQQTVADKVGDRPLPGPVSRLIGRQQGTDKTAGGSTRAGGAAEADTGLTPEPTASTAYGSGTNGLGRS